MEQPRAENGQFVTLREFVMSLMDERFSGLRKEIAKDLAAVELQATEYARRLEDLNHAHARTQATAATFVSLDKYEDQVASADAARVIALDSLDQKISHLDETLSNKLDDYITRYEADKRQLDQAIALGKGAADEAKRAAEEQGRKNNRNIGIASIALAIVIAIANWLGIA